VKPRRTKRPRRSDLVEITFLEGVRKRCPLNLRVLEALGELYTRAGLFEAGLAIDQELVGRRPDDPIAWYNLGCSLARMKQAEEACSALERAVALGYNDFQWMARDEDLHSLHGRPRFDALLRLGVSTPPAGSDRR